MLPDYNFKFIIIGDSGVGKSCLLLQFTDQRFEQDHIHTIGTEFATKVVKIDDRPIKLSMWDTAGHERFRSITRAYYRASAGVIVVYDVTRRETFSHIIKWLDDAREVDNPNMVITLVGNKCDVSRRREVSREEGEQFAMENGMIFMEASAKTSQNINEVFTSTAERILNNIDNGVYDLSNESCGIKVQHAQGLSGSGFGAISQKQQGGCCS